MRYQSKAKAKLTRFRDGSSLKDMGTSGWIIHERGAMPALTCHEQPAPYDQPPPKAHPLTP